MPYSITKYIDFCAGHRLINYEGNCANVHGHNFRAVVTLGSSELNEQGMVMDLLQIKHLIKGWVDSNWDHAFLVNEFDSPMKGFLSSQKQRFFVMDIQEMVQAHGILRPLDLEDSMRIAICNPTVENMSTYLRWQIVRQLHWFDHRVKVSIFESPTGFATAEAD